jgi:hypothetical protein
MSERLALTTAMDISNTMQVVAGMPMNSVRPLGISAKIR